MRAKKTVPPDGKREWLIEIPQLDPPWFCFFKDNIETTPYPECAAILTQAMAGKTVTRIGVPCNIRHCNTVEVSGYNGPPRGWAVAHHFPIRDNPKR